MSKFCLYGKLTAIEGRRDELLEILLDASNSMQVVEDCLLYVINICEDHPDDVIVYEVWTDEHAHQASLSLEATQTLIGRARPIIASMERFHTLQAVGGKGIS